MSLEQIIRRSLAKYDECDNDRLTFWDFLQDELIEHLDVLDAEEMQLVTGQDTTAALILLEFLNSETNGSVGFTFPAFTGKKFTMYDQALKIMEEEREAWAACSRWRDDPSDRNRRHDYLIELIDLIHAIESALRHEGVLLDEFERLVDEVYHKNKERGYYD